MRKRELNACKQDIYSFLHFSLPTNPEPCRFPAYSFHPNDNRATVVVSRSEFLRYLAAVGNTYEFIELY